MFSQHRSLPAPKHGLQKKQYVTSIGETVREATVEVYTSGFKEIHVIPKRHILHAPPDELKIARMILCNNFDAQEPETSCRMGNRCKFVHADLSQALKHSIHINYAWRSIEHCAYERFSESEGQLEVALPNGKTPEMLIPAKYVLRTKALDEGGRRPLSHCAHYFYSRACNRGPDCGFIHAVYIDPEARDNQRAPVPSRDKRGLQRHSTILNEAEDNKLKNTSFESTSDTSETSSHREFGSPFTCRFMYNPYSFTNTVHFVTSN